MDIPPNIAEIYARADEGKCMLCEQAVGEQVTLQVNGLGIITLFCSQVCMTDMMIKGFLEEVYDDLAERIQFRKDQSG